MPLYQVKTTHEETGKARVVQVRADSPRDAERLLRGKGYTPIEIRIAQDKPPAPGAGRPASKPKPKPAPSRSPEPDPLDELAAALDDDPEDESPRMREPAAPRRDTAKRTMPAARPRAQRHRRYELLSFASHVTVGIGLTLAILGTLAAIGGVVMVLAGTTDAGDLGGGTKLAAAGMAALPGIGGVIASCVWITIGCTGLAVRDIAQRQDH